MAIPDFGDNDEFQWIIDPLDGTTNFLHGFPQFSVSIALKHKGRLEQAVVYDPLRQELFTASRGSGAFLDNRRIRVSRQTGLSGALLGTGFPYKNQQHLDAYLSMFRALMIHEAGGLVGDLAGGHSYLENGNIVAATPKLFPAMLREIRPCLSDELPC